MSKNNQRKPAGRRKRDAERRRWQKMLQVKMNNKMGIKLVGLFLLVILALIALALRVTWINVNDGKQYERIVLSQTQQQYESRNIPFRRGDIRDRNGTILATSNKVYNLILDCKVVNSLVAVERYVDESGKLITAEEAKLLEAKNKKEPDTKIVEEQLYVEPTVKALVKLFNMDEQMLRNLLEGEDTKDSQYVILAENLSISEKQKLEEYTDLSADDKENMPDEEKQERMRIKGIWFEEDYLRVYPMNSLACDLIGFTNSDNSASYGIEGYYSDILNGTNGRRFGYFNEDASAEQTIIDPEAGKNVVSTIDVNVQQIIRSAMEKFIAKYSNGPNGEEAAENIGVVVMDPNTGEILGMDSSGWYDLNSPRLYSREEFQAMTEKEAAEKTDELAAMWKNFCISDSFEPGSTFKPVTIAAALETASADNSRLYYCDGLEEINTSTLHCAIYPGEHGELNLEGALKVSCNDVLMQVGEQLGASELLNYQELFNFGMKTGIDLPNENSGVLHQEENMGAVELATASFGQGFTCTMVQEAAAFSAIVNGGYYYKPHVVGAVTDSSGAVTEHISPVTERQVISSGVSSQIREWLAEVVQSGGSGENARVDGYSMGGKTGTAQKVDQKTKTYDGSYVVSFIGCAPVDNPEVVVYVAVDEPNVENQDSSVYAQEIAREIFIELLPYMNIFPEDPEAAEAFITQLREAERQTAEEQTTEGEAAEGQPTENLPAEAQIPEEQYSQEQPVLDTDIPVPPEEAQDSTDNGGEDSIYSDGIPNES